MNHTNPGIAFNGYTSMGGNHPPKKRIVVMAHINKIFIYSPNKNRTKGIPEYSVWYPATSSDSASGKSNGGLFVSASAEMKKTINIGNSGMKNQIFFWASTISLKFNEPTHIKTVTITKPIDTS